MPRLEWEEEWVQMSQIFAPARQTIARYNERLFKLAIELRGKLRVDELRQGLDIELQCVLVLGQNVIDIGVESMKNVQ